MNQRQSPKYFILLAVLILSIVLVACNASNSDREDAADEEDTPPSVPSCCVPFCTNTGQEECAQVGGTWSGVSCAAVPECKQGCCVPACQMASKAYCEMLTDDWRDGTCEQQTECQEVCCQPFATETTKVLCEQWGGTAEEAPCAAGELSGDLTFELADSSSCDCADDYRVTGGDTCTKKTAIQERIKFSADKDSVEKERGVYTVQGTAQYRAQGTAEHAESSSGSVFCQYGTPVSGESAMNKKYTRSMSGTQTVNAKLTFYQSEGVYHFVLELADIPGVNIVQRFHRTTTSTCQGATVNTEDTDDTFVEPGESFIEFSGSLQGSQSLERYWVNGYYCNDDTRVSANVRWNLAWLD